MTAPIASRVVKLPRLVALSVIVLSLSAPPAPATAAAVLCQGNGATIVSTGGTVTGTEHRDVIVATGHADIHARGGDDVICMEHGTLDAGAGDDVVLAGKELEPNVDKFDLGPGSDSLYVPLTAGSSVTASGGAGEDGRKIDKDILYIGSGVRDDLGVWDVDLAGTVTRDGVQVAGFDGFGSYYVGFDPTALVTVSGTNAAEWVSLYGGKFAIDMGRGDDEVRTTSYTRPTTGHFDGGKGKDLLDLLRYPTIDVDLASGDLGAGVEFESFSRYSFEAATVRIRGTRADEEIHAVACVAKVDARGGDDSVEYGRWPGECDERRAVLKGGNGHDKLRGTNSKERLLGGRGEDRLFGRANGDTLMGGPGRDMADGGLGTDDICKAEVERRCER